MGKKKRSHPDIEEVLAKPWCYYCERPFDDLRILISHQKAKHYKCERCGRRLNTAGGLSVHMNQVHKETLTTVENALPNRAAADIEIFGMEGIPEDILLAHNQRISHEYFAAEAERRAISGNPAPGASGNQGGGSGVKKPKIETPAELKKRLAEHKARKAAAEAGGDLSSDANTPGQTATPPVYQTPFPPPGVSPAHAAFPSPFGQPPQSAPMPTAPFYGSQPPAPFNYGDAFGGAPSGPRPGGFPPAGQFHAPPQFSPAPQHQYGGDHVHVTGFGPMPGFQPSNIPHQPQHAPAPFGQHNAPRLPGVSPPSQTPPQRQPSLPTAPGLPQRPTFNAPHVSREQLAEMHHGNVSASTDGQPAQLPSRPTGSATTQSVDDLISNAAQESTQANAAQTSAAATPTPAPEKPAAAEKKVDGDSKKSKKATRLVYPEQDASPEERMSSTSKYEFTPEKNNPTILGPVEGNVTGVVQDSDKVVDAQG